MHGDWGQQNKSRKSEKSNRGGVGKVKKKRGGEVEWRGKDVDVEGNSQGTEAISRPPRKIISNWTDGQVKAGYLHATDRWRGHEARHHL